MKRFLPFVLTIVLCMGSSLHTYGQVSEAGEEAQVPSDLRQLYAQSAVLMDADSGRVLFEKNCFICW